MMKDIKRFVFWVGGVIVPHISCLTLQILQPVTLDPAQEITLKEFERDVCFGVLKPFDYCHEAIKLFGLHYVPDVLYEEIKNRILISPEIICLLQEIIRYCEVSLISNFPDEWLEKVLGGLGTNNLESSCSVYRLPHIRNVLTHEQLISNLKEQRLLISKETLLIDDNSLRCMQAIRSGLLVNIFVDSYRLKRDLHLWGFSTAESKSNCDDKGGKQYTDSLI